MLQQLSASLIARAALSWMLGVMPDPNFYLHRHASVSSFSKEGWNFPKTASVYSQNVFVLPIVYWSKQS